MAASRWSIPSAGSPLGEAGPKSWTGFPELLPPEALLLDAENRRINWDGCETAVGAFPI